MSTQDRRRPDEHARKKTKQDVVYTQAKAFNRKRFLLQLVTVLAVVLALLFGMSIFFKVEVVLISGTDKYDPVQIQDASGIKIGENLLTLNKQRISANIHNKLPYIDSVQIGRKLPGTVVIHVTELNVTYAIQDQAGNYWLLNNSGRVVDKSTATQAQEMTNILGVKLANPQIGADAVAFEPQTGDTALLASDQLKIALSVIANMEQNGFIGGDAITKVDVTNVGNIELSYQNRILIKLGDSSRLGEKFSALSGTIAQMGDHESKILDASFTVYPDGIEESTISPD